MSLRAALTLALGLQLVACTSGATLSTALQGTLTSDAGTSTDAGTDTAYADAGASDAGTITGVPDASTDAPDAGASDAGTTSELPDASADAPDAGVSDAGLSFGDAGPWPISNQTFGSAEGITESPVIATSTDEAQNLWVATPSALYLMRPGATSFTRYDASSGLHLAGNPVLYDEDYCDGETGVTGSATSEGISTLVGGASNEVFVGYHGTLAVNGDCTDPATERHSGKLDRVVVQDDGTLVVTRLDMVSTGMGMTYWHNRTVYRLAYDHFVHPHTLYVGTDHGVDMMYPDAYRAPASGEWTGISIQEWMADHVHVQVCYDDDATCVAGGEGNARMGDWRGLAIDPNDGDLWHAGRWSAGKIRWVSGLHDWSFRSGAQAFSEAFGTDGIPPVFQVSTLGDVVSLSAVTVAADGTAWFSSAYFYGSAAAVPSAGSGLGLAHYLGDGAFAYYSPYTAGMTEQDVQDMVALPDGRLVLAGANSGLVFWNPNTGASTVLRAGSTLPDDRVYQLELDTMVTPPALHVSTYSGAATLRVFP